MAINELTTGEAVTRSRLNSIIKSLNALEDSNNLQGYVKTQGATYSSLDDYVLVQGVRVSITDSTPDSWLIDDVPFPRPFSAPPVVTVSMFGSGASAVTPYVTEITATKCTIRVQKIEPTFAWPVAMNCNIIAIGPTNAI